MDIYHLPVLTWSFKLLALKLFNWVKIDIGKAVDQRFTLVDNHAFEAVAPKITSKADF